MEMAVPSMDEPLISLRNKLKTLCTCWGSWSYAIFWSFHPHDSLLLTMEDAYYEEQLGEEIAKMLPQFHLLGEGIVGEAAFTGMHKWVHSDGENQEWNIFENDFGLLQQLSSGIKTIVVIPVKACGVVQFGSKTKILERVEFLEQTQRLLLEMDDMSMLYPFVDAAWSGEVSYLDDALGQQLLYEVSSLEGNSFGFSNNTIQDSSLTSLSIMDTEEFQDNFQNLLDNQHSAQSSFVNEVNFPSIEPVDMSEEFLEFSSMDDLFSQWFAPSSEDNICKTEFNPTSFDLVGTSSISEEIPVTCLPEQNSIIHDAINLDGKETSLVMPSFENCLLENMELDLSFDQCDELWRSLLTPVVSSANDTSFSECTFEFNIGTMNDNLGNEELLSSETNYNLLNDYVRQMVEFSPLNNGNPNPIQFSNNVMQPNSNMGNNTNNVVSKNETFSKLHVGMWIDDIHRINVGNGAPIHSQKMEQPKKPTKKKARPGESTRPRPKDRQRIQACIEELRKIIPKTNDGKFSIDCLLERTIRYMLFLRSITMYADKLQEPNEPKLIDQANGVVLHNTNVEDSRNCGGFTWALDMSGQTLVCPIIVEDMDQPGQLLIEMLIEEQDFFLELADTIRGFGLNILKAKMEIRKNKLWARFIVEAHSHVTRIDVFWSLIHLLQQTNSSEMDSASKHSNVVDAGISGLSTQSPENNDAITHGHDRSTLSDNISQVH